MTLGNYKIEFQQKKETPESLELYIYDDVQGDKYSFWTGEVRTSETSQDFFREKLDEFKDVKYINLFINSAGGSVLEGYGINAQLLRHPAYKTAYVDGFANSIASIIAMSCNKIIMRINSIMGIHNISDICFGNAAQHRKTAEDLDRLMEGNRQIYLNRSKGKLTEEQLTKLLDEETMLTAEDCLRYGLCDEIADFVKLTVDAEEVMEQKLLTMEMQLKRYRQMEKTMTEMTSAIKTPPLPPPEIPEENDNPFAVFFAK